MLALLVFVALAAWGAISSKGFLEADGCTHYLYDKFALLEPHYLVNVWGRPFKTILYALPAFYGGLLGVRLTSIVLAVVTGVLCYRIAVRQGYRRPELAILFLVGQPLFFLHSFSELTELPFAFLLALAFRAYQARWWPAFALVVGLMPLSRPEGFAMLVLAAGALVLHRRWYWLVILFLPLVVWNHAGWVLYGRQQAWWRWLPDNWPYAGDSIYGVGRIYRFVVVLPMLISPLLFPFMWIGVARSLRPLRAFFQDHRVRCQVLIAALPLSVLAGHSILHALGKMASNGELRYLITVSPLWALCSAAGWEWAFTHFRWRRMVPLASAAVLLPIGLNFIYPIVPLKLDTNWQDAERVAVIVGREIDRRSTELGASGAGSAEQPGDAQATATGQRRHPMLMAAHPGINYFLDVSSTDRQHVIEWWKDNVLHPPQNTLLVWEDVYAKYNADLRRSVELEDIQQAGWREIPLHGLAEPQRWKLFESPDMGRPKPND